ncbi:pancreatic lipase-related protein 2-like isoform X1 [Ascaphus truei]|uniref:pancreatic lipase-related protein 2-like isoform X1 n=1 Tax=Ascaphus truei TaxID=8439 RepID=UPI003F5925BF
MLVLLLTSLLMLGMIKGKEVCYGTLGCFSDDPPWSGTLQRPLPALPWTPETINTRFFLYTRENSNQKQEISAKLVTSIKASSFQTTRKTCFIVHGMADKAEDNWVSNMCREILQVEDINCIGVDWRHGSGNVHIYVQAANNVRVVGAEIAVLLKLFQEEFQYSASEVHIIGHSLGAHVAGEAGERHRGIRRISALDAARLFFEDTPEEVRLDASDADFVDVIHTDSSSPLGLGIGKAIGHFDFYPNGGRHMPGCEISILSNLGNINGFVEKLVCNHLRAFQYYTESIRNPSSFLSFPCQNYDMFNSGACFPCPTGGCPSMGYFADSSHGITAKHQTFYLSTGGILNQLPCWRYKVSVTLNGKNSIHGQIYISISATGGRTKQYEVINNYLVPGNTFSGFIDAEFELGAISDVTFRWSPLLFNIFQFQLGAERIEVQSGKDGNISAACSTGTVREGVLQTLTPCKDLPSNA